MFFLYFGFGTGGDSEYILGWLFGAQRGFVFCRGRRNSQPQNNWARERHINFEHINFLKSGQPWDNPPVNQREKFIFPVFRGEHISFLTRITLGQPAVCPRAIWTLTRAKRFMCVCAFFFFSRNGSRDFIQYCGWGPEEGSWVIARLQFSHPFFPHFPPSFPFRPIHSLTPCSRFIHPFWLPEQSDWVPLWSRCSDPLFHEEPCQPKPSKDFSGMKTYPQLRRSPYKHLEEDKRATTNVQNRFVQFFLLSFLLFCYPWAKTLCFEGESPGGKILKKCQKVWKSVKNYETILPFSCCPLVFPWNTVKPTSSGECLTPLVLTPWWLKGPLAGLRSLVWQGVSSLLEIPRDSCHFFCTPGNPCATPIVTRGEGSFSYQGVSNRGLGTRQEFWHSISYHARGNIYISNSWRFFMNWYSYWSRSH